MERSHDDLVCTRPAQFHNGRIYTDCATTHGSSGGAFIAGSGLCPGDLVADFTGKVISNPGKPDELIMPSAGVLFGDAAKKLYDNAATA